MKALEKLDEAKYFLEQIKSNIENDRALKHNLSAFLSSARSITFVLQNEYSDNPNFGTWYAKKQEEMRNDNLLSFFVNKRNYVVKENSITPIKQRIITISDVGTAYESVTVMKKNPDGTEVVSQSTEQIAGAHIKPKDTEVEVKWFFEDYPDKDIITLCEDYLGKLIQILGEARTIVLL
jgi:hypothetical protein